MLNIFRTSCGISNIDDYKTSREIELEKKLKIAVKALEDIKSYAPSCFNKDDCPLFNENCGCISEGGCFALASYLALAKIKEIEG